MIKLALPVCAAFVLMFGAAPSFATETAVTETVSAVTTPVATTGVGAPAPAFTATDSNGKTVNLSDYKGQTVVLEWTNDQCPYVRKFYDTNTMQDLQRAATAKGAVWLTVLSSAKGKQGYVDGAGANKIMADEKAAPTAYLLDADGALGRLYGAQTSPHMFVIDKDGTLVYAGGIDDQPSVNHSTVKTANNYVKAALADLDAGQPVKIATAKPYGCGIKY